MAISVSIPADLAVILISTAFGSYFQSVCQYLLVLPNKDRLSLTEALSVSA